MKKILSLIALLVILSMSLIACSSQEVLVEQPVAVTAEETYGPPVPEEIAETSIEVIESVETVG
jgi:hypothetical protein